MKHRFIAQAKFSPKQVRLPERLHLLTLEVNVCHSLSFISVPQLEQWSQFHALASALLCFW